MDQDKVNYVYNLIDSVHDINVEIREEAFNSKNQQLWNLYEVGHQAQLALAAFVVALQASQRVDT